MIRGNLATRPFYNEPAVHLVAVRRGRGGRAWRRCSTSSRCCATPGATPSWRAQAVERRSPGRGAPRRGGAAARQRRREADRTRVARGAAGERADRSPDVLLDGAVQRVRSDAAAQRPHHVVPAAHRAQARQRRHHLRSSRAAWTTCSSSWITWTRPGRFPRSCFRRRSARTRADQSKRRSRSSMPPSGRKRRPRRGCRNPEEGGTVTTLTRRIFTEKRRLDPAGR